MQVRANLTPSELQEAARLSRPKKFWLRLFVANWYATAICILVLGAAFNGLIHHQPLHWESLAGVFAVGAFFIWLSWFRWTSAIAKSADTVSARSAMVVLDPDGIRSTFANRGSSFAPWSSFSTWKEGRGVFLLSGDNTAIIPIDDTTRESIRSLLMSRIT